MGLDAVELVMDVEDHFGVTIQDAEAERIRTVADLVELIRSRVSASQDAYCSTLPAFLKLRSTLRTSIGDANFRIRPSQQVAEQLTASQRRLFWKQLTELLGTAPRDLRRPQLLRMVLRAILIVLLSAALLSAIAVDLKILPLTLALAISCSVGMYVATIPFKSYPPDDWMTFDDITTKLVGVRTATRQLSCLTADNVLAEVRPLIVDALGVQAEEVIPGARFVEDLGID